MTELAPGIHRIESVLGPRPFSQYLLRSERSLLVDTGINTTPADVILPFFETAGLDPEGLDYVVLSHADVDHFGGNEAIRAVAPRAVFCAHDLDSDWIGDRERILRERYGWYAAHGSGADYDQPTKDFLASAMGADVPVDLRLQGGERFRLGPRLDLEVLALPGHSGGHIGLWDRSSRTAIVIDAILGGGLYDMNGTIIHPPPYFAASAYEASIARVRELQPHLLLTAHYAPMEGKAVADFLDLSQAFVARARVAVTAVIKKEKTVTLAGLLAELVPALGPFTSFPNELGGPIRAHLRELVASGKANEAVHAGVPAWTWNG